MVEFNVTRFVVLNKPLIIFKKKNKKINANQSLRDCRIHRHLEEGVKNCWICFNRRIISDNIMEKCIYNTKGYTKEWCLLKMKKKESDDDR